jgi:general transcription factor IIIA
MVTPPVLSNRKRKAFFSASSYSPSASDRDLDPSEPETKLLTDSPPSTRLYKCEVSGCTKAYTKPSRLAEHKFVHTGQVRKKSCCGCDIPHIVQQRPYVCATCCKDYRRASHLQAHSSSHLAPSSRQFTCSAPDCDKRFSTAQHLRRHEDMHKRGKPFAVRFPCDASLLENDVSSVR